MSDLLPPGTPAPFARDPRLGRDIVVSYRGKRYGPFPNVDDACRFVGNEGWSWDEAEVKLVLKEYRPGKET